MTRSAFLVITDQFWYYQNNQLYSYLTEHGLLSAHCQSLDRLQTPTFHSDRFVRCDLWLVPKYG